MSLNVLVLRYRERRERVPSRFELFFDLVFVAIAHQMSDAAAEQAGGTGVAQFILVCFVHPATMYLTGVRRHSCTHALFETLTCLTRNI